MATPQKKHESDAVENALHALGLNETQIKESDSQEKQLKTAPKPHSLGEVKPATRSGKKLNGGRIQLRGYLHNSWDVTVERGTTLIDALDPEFWAHVASQLKPHDSVQIISEDGTWFARLLVISADRLWAKMYKLEYHDLTASYVDMPKTQEEEYEVTWTSIGKYAVHKKSLHGQPALKDGFQTKLEAYTWLDGHLRTINS